MKYRGGEYLFPRRMLFFLYLILAHTIRVFIFLSHGNDKNTSCERDSEKGTSSINA